MNGQLNLAEQLMWLSLSDEGEIRPRADRLAYALAAAVLAELTHRGFLALRGNMLQLARGDRPGDPVLDYALVRITPFLPMTAPAAVKFFSQRDRSLAMRVLDRLAQKGLVRPAEKRVFGLWSRPVFIPVGRRDAAVARMRRALYDREDDTMLFMLLALIHMSHMQHFLFPPEEAQLVEDVSNEALGGWEDAVWAASQPGLNFTAHVMAASSWVAFAPTATQEAEEGDFDLF